MGSGELAVLFSGQRRCLWSHCGPVVASRSWPQPPSPISEALPGVIASPTDPHLAASCP